MTSGDGSYSLSFQQMAYKVDELAVQGQNLEQELEALKSQINSALDPNSWTAGARDEWSAAQTVWTNKTQDMHQKIVAVQKALDAIHNNYQVTEKQAQSMWSNSGLADNGSGVASNGYQG